MYIGVDVGGTFTDIAINRDDGSNLLLHKLPSTPDAPEQAIVEGLRMIMEQEGLSAANVRRLAHGTTVGTNALIQRKCGTVGLITSRGFRDLLEIGRQTRPAVYDMHSDHPAPLVERHLRIDVPQRTLADGSVHVPLDEDAVREAAGRLAAAKVDCVVVCFLHSYAFPADEQRAAQILLANLPNHVTVISSSSVYPEFREYERFSTTVLNAALITIIGSYLDRLTASVAGLGVPSEVKISQSAGGLMSVRMAREYPIRASLSGPAAGVQGALRRATAAGFPDIITLDVGGTSADVALLRDGTAVEVNERDLAGFPIRIPALDVNAVGAGGGSIAWIDRDGLLKVGPRSAGAVPGPLCYDLGGTEPTVTDANVMLGRLNNETLLDGRMPIEAGVAVDGITRLATALEVTPDETALGILRVACATMVKAIRSISVERGHTPSDFALFVYGGAGALFASDVARELGMKRVVVPPDPGILCAEGAMNAALSTDFVTTILAPLGTEGLRDLRSAAEELQARAANWFTAESVPVEQERRVWTIGARYFGQNYELTLPFDLTLSSDRLMAELKEAFHAKHETTYGFASKSEPIQIVNVAVKAIGELERPSLPVLSEDGKAAPVSRRPVLFDNDHRVDTPVYARTDLFSGQLIAGPAIVEQMDTTVVIFPEETAVVDLWGNLVIDIRRL
ncbi:hydantoinase/oxoprolinase family protein [Pelagibius sp. Alg239-R121]|uniref:hydantoinase/oxoprolinase family protein n=1 Tax=Pelagibius sp. Alg239-R121 TaxID=2993448 RepID=UPI0024A6F448|nr:hydantoinase/oxoprolinase family protein [Pelagibius sp. Alg239-R121]